MEASGFEPSTSAEPIGALGRRFDGRHFERGPRGNLRAQGRNKSQHNGCGSQTTLDDMSHYDMLRCEIFGVKGRRRPPRPGILLASAVQNGSKWQNSPGPK